MVVLTLKSELYTLSSVWSLTLGAHAQEGYSSWFVCVCVCVSVKLHLTSGASVRPENTVTYSAGKEEQKISLKPLHCGDPALPPLKAIHTVGHFPWIGHIRTRWCRGFCTLVHSFHNQLFTMHHSIRLLSNCFWHYHPYIL